MAKLDQILRISFWSISAVLLFQALFILLLEALFGTSSVPKKIPFHFYAEIMLKGSIKMGTVDNACQLQNIEIFY